MMGIARILLVALAALLLAVQAVRTAVVAEFAESDPARASRIWPSHPAAELWLGLTQIGRATHERKSVSADVLRRIDDAAAKAPLAPEPFLVRGVEAQLAGRPVLAERAFLAAKLRNGRSVPARYFLAEQYFRSGDARGLSEIAVLAHMLPNGVTSLAPYVAAYARDRKHWPRLRDLFRSNAQLEDATFGALAADARNADLILALRGPQARSGETPTWAGLLLYNLVKAGDYWKAFEVWSRVTHARRPAGALIFDPGFEGSDAPPPFNWTLTSSTVGLAERQPGGRLHVIYYGQEDGVLASQLLLLPPGAYRFSLQVSGDRARARPLSWTLTCARSSNRLADLPLANDRVSGSRVDFTVPAGCRAQELELRASAPDLPQQVDVTVSGLDLVSTRPNG